MAELCMRGWGQPTPCIVSPAFLSQDPLLNLLSLHTIQVALSAFTSFFFWPNCGQHQAAWVTAATGNASLLVVHIRTAGAAPAVKRRQGPALVNYNSRFDLHFDCTLGINSSDAAIQGCSLGALRAMITATSKP